MLHLRLMLVLAAMLMAWDLSGAQRFGSTVRIGPIEISDRGSRFEEQVSIGNNVVVPAGETNRDVVVILGDAKIDGTVTGDLVVILGRVEVGPAGRVERPMVLVGGDLEVHPDGYTRGVEGPRLAFPYWLLGGLRDWLRFGLLWARPLPHQPSLAWWFAAGFLALYLLVALFMPQAVRQGAAVLQNRPATCLLMGLLTLVLVGPLTVLLVASVVGIVLVPFVHAAFSLALVFGKVLVYRTAGRHVGAQFGAGILEHPVPSVLVGALLFFLSYMIPVLGLIIWGVASASALGTVVLWAFQSLRSETAELGGGAPASWSAPAGVAEPGSAQELPAPMVLPRAGFWIRLAATLLDAVLIGTVAVIFEKDWLFLFLWVAYHLTMWTWKGTTIGGVVMGLKIVRLNGAPLTFSVVLVRCLSAFYSALVLCLGFFWVGWNRERQSWHDIIAGTVIVRYPKGSSLV